MMLWYAFTGTDSLNPTHYQISNKQVETSGTRTIAAIFTSGNLHPDIDYNLICYMVLALSSHKSNERVILKD